MFALTLDDPAVTAYTAIIQFGAIAATVLYFFKDLVRLVGAWLAPRRARTRLPARLGGHRGFDPGGCDRLPPQEGDHRRSAQPVGHRGSPHPVERGQVGGREANGVQRGEGQVTMCDGLIIGLAPCFSLIHGVSRSGATISAGLIKGLDRVTPTRLSFFMAIAALTAAGPHELRTSTSARSARVR
jgi:undecaprenyl-diphosphatase